MTTPADDEAIKKERLETLELATKEAAKQKTEAETAKLRLERKLLERQADTAKQKTLEETAKLKLEQELLRWQTSGLYGFVSPAGVVSLASGLIVLYGLFSGAVSNWFNARQAQVEGETKKLEADKLRLTIDTTLLTLDKTWMESDKAYLQKRTDLLQRQTDYLHEKEIAVANRVNVLEAELRGSQEEREGTQNFFAALVSTEASFGQWGKEFRLSFEGEYGTSFDAPPTGPPQTSDPGSSHKDPTIAPKRPAPRELLEALHQGRFVPVVKSMLLDRITLVRFSDCEIGGPDLKNLEAMPALRGVEIGISLWNTSSKQDSILDGLEAVGDRLTRIELSGEFNPDAVAAAIGKLKKCEVVNLGDINVTPVLANAIRGLQELREVRLTRGELSPSLLEHGLSVELLGLDFLDFSALRGIRQPDLPNLERFRATGETLDSSNKQLKPVDGDLLVWVMSAPKLRIVELRNVKITAALDAAMRRISAEKVATVWLHNCTFDSKEIRESLSLHFGPKILFHQSDAPK